MTKLVTLRILALLVATIYLFNATVHGLPSGEHEVQAVQADEHREDCDDVDKSKAQCFDKGTCAKVKLKGEEYVVFCSCKAGWEGPRCKYKSVNSNWLSVASGSVFVILLLVVFAALLLLLQIYFYCKLRAKRKQVRDYRARERVLALPCIAANGAGEQLIEEAADGQPPERAAIEQLSGRAADGQLSERAADGQLSGRAAIEQLSGRAADGQLSGRAADRQLSEEAAKVAVPEQAANGLLPVIHAEVANHNINGHVGNGHVEPAAAQNARYLIAWRKRMMFLSGIDN